VLPRTRLSAAEHISAIQTRRGTVLISADRLLDGSLLPHSNLLVAGVLQSAVSGRAKCRACGRPIAGGEIRFGDVMPNPYGEGETTHWFHLACAACARPEQALATLASTSETLPEREWLERTAEGGLAHNRVPRIARTERSPSGRARCRQCRELIEQGAWRIGLQMYEEGRFTPIGFIHVACSEPYFGTRDILDRIERMTPELSADAVSEIGRLLTEAPPVPLEAGPSGLAKTQAPSSEADAAPEDRAKIV
jgi:hypothetical protein